MKRISPFGNQQGMTLIEVIATLVIMGLIGAGISSFILYGVEGYMLAKANTDAFQKSYIALERLSREMKSLEKIYEADTGAIRYSRGGQAFGIAFSNREVRMIRGNLLPDTPGTGSVLIDNMASFEIELKDAVGNIWTIPADSRIDGLSKIVVRMTVAIENSTRSFLLEINPLYNNTVNGPTS